MDKKKCIIVIEDELVVQQSIVDTLTRNGFDVFAYDNAERVLNGDIISVADAIIMDIQLPGIDGWHATSRIKSRDASMPVIMLTAYSDVNYRVQGFETGADDYIIKPFFMEELVARLKAVLKRYEMVPGRRSFYELGDLSIDIKSKVVIRADQVIKLSLTEFNLLALLAQEQGNPVSKEEIMQKVWRGRYSVGDNTIEVYINLLRNKIDKPFSKKLIHTKPGFGYYLSENNIN
jgi:two-component system, OmpR family, copper resistance phosphate regulon response regulator CusR